MVECGSRLEQTRNIIRDPVWQIDKCSTAINDDVLSASRVVLGRDDRSGWGGDAEAVDADAVVGVDAAGDGDNVCLDPGCGVVGYVRDATDGQYAAWSARRRTAS